MLNIAECKRNIWLEFSSQRLVLMPLILGSILFLTHLFNEGEPIADYAESLSSRISVLYVLIVLVWGAVLVSRSLNEEIAQRSWDFQRMSALSGIEMTFGKIFGATAYAWYGGLLLIGAYIGVAVYADIPLSTVTFDIAHFVLTAIFVHATVLMFAAILLRNPEYRIKPRGRIFYLMAVLGYSIPMLFVSQAFDSASGLFAEEELAQSSWYGLEIPLENMVLITLAMHVAWALFAAVRMVSAELQYRQASLGWPLFILFCIAWYSGYEWEPELPITRVTLDQESFYAVVFSVVGLYLGMLADRIGVADYRAFFHNIRHKLWSKAAARLPWWLSSYVIALPSLAIAASQGGQNNAIYAGMAALVITRDIALYHSIQFAGAKRATGTFIVYGFMLYLLLPVLFEELGWEQIQALLVPVKQDLHILTLTSLAVQAVLLVGLCVMRYMRAKPTHEVASKRA